MTERSMSRGDACAGSASPPTNPNKGGARVSDHGRGVAVDFQVFKGKKEIAGISTSAATIAVWMKDGWFEKLKTACSGTRLKGPLEKPYEPWHWWLDGTAQSDE